MDRDLDRVWRRLDPAQPADVVWIRRAPAERATVLLGAFDPPTLAHVAIVLAAARHRDAPAAFCLTKQLLDRPGDELLDDHDKLGLLDDVAGSSGLGLVVANRGTYVAVAGAMRARGLEPSFVIGSDKLSQLADPSFYADGLEGVAATFGSLDFLVVPRTGFDVVRDDVEVLDAGDVFDDPSLASITATEVRRRVRTGRSFQALVPPAVARVLEGYTSAEPR